MIQKSIGSTRVVNIHPVAKDKKILIKGFFVILDGLSLTSRGVQKIYLSTRGYGSKNIIFLKLLLKK